MSDRLPRALPGFGGRYRIERWSPDPIGWQRGAPGIIKVGMAIEAWAILQERDISVAEAARVFNIDADRVVEAVLAHPRMGVQGPSDDHARLFLVLDGETP